MPEHSNDPVGRWDLIFHGTGVTRRGHTRQEWAQIADAIRTADRLRAGTVRGDAGWCQAAVDAYTRLHDTDAYTNLHAQTAGWPADEHLIRALLDAPPVPPGPHATMLHAYGFDHTFAPEHWTHPMDLTVLVTSMQELGIVGTPDQRVSVLRAVAGGTTHDDLVQVVLWQPSQPPRASNPVHVSELALPAASPADRIVAALHNIAATATQLAGSDHPPPAEGRHRHTAEPLPAGVDGHPIGTRPRPFRLITGGAAQPTTPPAIPPPAPTTRHSRT